MVEYSRDQLSVTFHALAHPLRREIVALLIQQVKATVLEIAAHFDISLNGVSKHLKVLEKAGVLQRDIQGRIHYCSLRPEALQEAEAWLAYYRQFWQTRLDALEQFLEEQKAEQTAVTAKEDHAASQPAA
jgi:DNA-binding transcriptional ArsR family regulator